MEEKKVTEGPKDEKNKIRKRFDNVLSEFTLVIGGELLFKPTKLASTEIMEAVKELAADEKKTAVEEFKLKVKALIKKKRDHDKKVTELRKKFEQEEEESMKGFADEADQLRKLMGDIKKIEKGYYDTLVGAATGSPEEESKEEEKDTEKDK